MTLRARLRATRLGLAATALACGPALAQTPTAEDLQRMHAAPPTPQHDMPGGGGRGGGGGGGRRSAGNPLERSEGARLLTQAGVTCQAQDGALLSSHGREALYELSCKDGLGWFVQRDDKGAVTAIDCLMVAGTTRGLQHCLLPGNRSQIAGLQAIVDQAKATCTVTDGVWLGAGGKPPIVRYEATCAQGGGYILDTPKPGTTSDLIATSCKDAPGLGLKCILAPPKG